MPLWDQCFQEKPGLHVAVFHGRAEEQSVCPCALHQQLFPAGFPSPHFPHINSEAVENKNNKKYRLFLWLGHINATPTDSGTADTQLHI